MDYTEVIEEERQPQDQLLSQAQDKRAGKELIFTKFFVVGIVDKSGSRGSRGQLPSSFPPPRLLSCPYGGLHYSLMMLLQELAFFLNNGVVWVTRE